MIYVFKTHQPNISNLFLAVFLEAIRPLAYGTCRYPMTHDGFFDLDAGDFAKQMCEDPAKKFRHIHWPDKIDQLRQIYNQANQHIVCGSHHKNQIEYLKSQFDKELTTVGINYTTDSYQWLLKNIAKNHVRLLTNHTLSPSDYDQELMGSLSKQELIDHYQSAFDELELIPKSVVDNFDYSIDVVDFVDKDKVTAHVNALGIEFSQAASIFYDQWRLAHQF